MESIASKVFRRNPTVSFSRFGDEGLLVIPKKSLNVVLNGVGARVFELIDGQRTVLQVADQLRHEFDTQSSDGVEGDVEELVQDLVSKGAIEENPS